jgi:hypothetical protein
MVRVGVAARDNHYYRSGIPAIGAEQHRMARTRWRAWEDLRRFWDYRRTAWAAEHLRQWLWRASHSRLRPFQKLAHTLRAHRDGVLAWTRIRVTNGAGSSGSVRSSGNTSKWIVFFRRAAFAKGQTGKSPTTQCGCSMNSSDHRSMAAMASSGCFDLTGGKPSADRGPWRWPRLHRSDDRRRHAASTDRKGPVAFIAGRRFG